MAAKALGVEPVSAAGWTFTTGIERVPDVKAAAHPGAVPLRLPATSGTTDARSSATERPIPLQLEDERPPPAFRPARLDPVPIGRHAAIVELISFNSIRMTTI